MKKEDEWKIPNIRNVFKYGKELLCYFRPAPKLVLFFHMAVWFILGAAASYIICLLAGRTVEDIEVIIISAGAFLSLIGGYFGGMLWLVNKSG